MDRDGNMDNDQEKTTIKSWLIVSGLALLFFLYGLFIYFTVGDKGVPGWDFGQIADTPGESAYSVSPQPTGNSGIPLSQHVSEKPSLSLDLEEGKE